MSTTTLPEPWVRAAERSTRVSVISSGSALTVMVSEETALSGGSCGYFSRLNSSRTYFEKRSQSEGWAEKSFTLSES